MCTRHRKSLTAIICLVMGVAIILINGALMSIFELDKQAFTDTSDFYFIGEFMLGSSFFSADYFPIFPSVGYVLIGAGIAPFLYPYKKSLLPFFGKYDWYRPFTVWGRIALPVYILHQVLITAIMALISFLFLTPGDFIFF